VTHPNRFSNPERRQHKLPPFYQCTLRQVVLEGRVVTMDALLTQRQLAQQSVEAGGA
jgi:hypothetical protein